MKRFIGNKISDCNRVFLEHLANFIIWKKFATSVVKIKRNEVLFRKILTQIVFSNPTRNLKFTIILSYIKHVMSVFIRANFCRLNLNLPHWEEKNLRFMIPKSWGNPGLCPGARGSNFYMHLLYLYQEFETCTNMPVYSSSVNLYVPYLVQGLLMVVKSAKGY